MSKSLQILVKLCKSLSKRVLRVLRSLRQLLPRDIIAPLHARRIVESVVRAAGGDVHPPPRVAINQRAIGKIEQNDGVRTDALVLQEPRLFSRLGEIVEKKSIAAVRPACRRRNDVREQPIRNGLSLVQKMSQFFAEDRPAALDRVRHRVSGVDVTHTVALLEHRADGRFAASRGSKKEDVHFAHPAA